MLQLILIILALTGAVVWLAIIGTIIYIWMDK